MQFTCVKVSGWGNQFPRATADRNYIMDDSVEGPSTTEKQKIEDRGSLKSCSYYIIYVNVFLFIDCHSGRATKF